MNKRLLLEGNNDVFVVGNAWLKLIGTDAKRTFEAINCNGISNVLSRIKIEIKAGYKAFGVVIDADTDILKNWNAIRKEFENAGAILPVSPPSNGFIGSVLSTKIGIWVMPDNQLSGKLEDFLEMLIPLNDDLITEVRSSLDEIERKNKNRYAPKDRPKALIHTWLAWQSEPGQPFGKAIEMKYFDANSQICKDFVNWLHGLFS